MTIGMLASFSFVDSMGKAAEEGVGRAERGGVWLDAGGAEVVILKLPACMGMRDLRPPLKPRQSFDQKAKCLVD